ncbi:MAG: hypothetical protein JWN25_868 [Verrucomicrobiales bacterium]|nr:hypothetical protein [Verrucomicrobiales bacterium]
MSTFHPSSLSRKNFLLVALLAAGQFLLTGLVLAQPQAIPNVKVKVHFSAPIHEGNTLKGQISGQEIQPLDKGNIYITNFVLRTFQNGLTNQVETTIEGPQCIYNLQDNYATSTNTLILYSGNTNYFIQGVGFRWLLGKTNTHLNISNNVYTRILRQEGTQTNASPLEVRSSQFTFDSAGTGNEAARTAIYRRDVVAKEAGMALRCDLLTVQFPGSSNTVRYITAEENVELSMDSGKSIARGKIARYDSVSGIIELEGNPTWKDQERDVIADKFTFDRNNRLLIAEGNAILNLPNSAFSQPAFLSAETPGKDSLKKGFYKVLAKKLTVYLSDSGSTPEKLVAEGDVTIESDDGKQKASGSIAIYDQVQNTIVLQGNPKWVSGQTSLSGDLLSLGSQSKTVAAMGNAVLKFPAPAALSASPLNLSNALPVVSNQFVTITSERFLYESNLAIFKGQVKGELSSNSLPVARLSAGWLQIGFNTSNRVESIFSQEAVHWQFLPVTNLNYSLERNGFSDFLALKWWPNKPYLQSLDADGAVRYEETKLSLSTNLPVYQAITTEHLSAEFASTTNELRTAKAEGEMTVRQNNSYAKGEFGLYYMTNGKPVFDIKGSPMAAVEKPGSKVRSIISHAALLQWDVISNTFKIKGPFAIDPESTVNTTNTTAIAK